ncbi:MAG: DAK2 domain-containing protein [Kyrpidia sp.]|nr:DAK2 domain-containing protein [Kyrpidia sp.]
MEDRRLGGRELAEALEAAGRRLSEARPTLNRLNVFPVPDADTGTNLVLTFQAGLGALAEASTDDAGDALRRFAKGLLFGARGNSGVILSQFFLGLAQALEGVPRVSVRGWGEAWTRGAGAACRAVDRPVEGTILTVARESARAWLEEAEQGWERAARAAVSAAQSILRRGAPGPSGIAAPGAVDSGALGFTVMLEAFAETVSGVSVDRIRIDGGPPAADVPAAREARAVPSAEGEGPYGYCTECLIHLFTGEDMRAEIEAALADLGDSRLVVQTDDVAKVHIHSFHPGRVLESCLAFGPLSHIKIDNMQWQAQGRPGGAPCVAGSGSEGRQGVKRSLLAAVDSAGVARLFEGLGVPAVVLSGAGGRTAAAGELSRAVQGAERAEIAVLVCQNRVESRVKEALRPLAPAAMPRLIRARSVPEGLAAVCVFDPARPLEENERRMKEAMARVRSGVLRKVSRPNSRRLGVRPGVYVGMVNDEVVAAGDAIPSVLLRLIENLVAKDAELVTVVWGKRVTAQDERTFRELASRRFPGLSFEWLRGDESAYDATVGVE